MNIEVYIYIYKKANRANSECHKCTHAETIAINILLNIFHKLLYNFQIYFHVIEMFSLVQ